MPRNSEIQQFAHPKLKEIYEFLAENNISYTEAAKRFGYSSASGVHNILFSKTTNKAVQMLVAYEQWKQEV